MDHLRAFNEAKHRAEDLGLDEFVFRGRMYERSSFANGYPCWRNANPEFRGSRKKKIKKKSKGRSRRSRRSRRC